MPPKVQKSKAAKLLAAQSASKGKGKKKKWSKGKMREKRNNLVTFNKSLWAKVQNEIPKMKVVTIYNLIENYKINGSLARRAIRELVSAKKLVCVAPGAVYAGGSAPAPATA
jgi:small subunit ribosomal protein S25e